MWLTEDWSRVETRSACGRHLAIARAAGGCLTFAYGCLPPASTLMPLINAEIARRQQAQWRPHVVYYPTMGGTSTANFGGMRWTINFGTP